MGGGVARGSCIHSLALQYLPRKTRISRSATDRPGRVWSQSGGHYAACSRAGSEGLQRSLCVTVNTALIKVITMAVGATDRHYAGVEAPRSCVGWSCTPDLNSTEQLRENIRVLLNLLQSNTASVEGLCNTTLKIWEEVPLDTICQLLRSSPYVTSTVPWAAGTELTHSGFIIYLFVYLFISQACWLRLPPHRKRV